MLVEGAEALGSVVGICSSAKRTRVEDGLNREEGKKPSIPASL